MLTANFPVWAFYAVLGYVFAFMTVCAFLYVWRISRRKERPPEKFKLLRGPGETLRRRVQKADDDFSQYVLIGDRGFCVRRQLDRGGIIAFSIPPSAQE